MKRLHRALNARLRTWAARRHGTDRLPLKIHRRRIYIVPTRFGMALAVLLMAMLVAGLNYNSNLGLAFGFLMTSLTLVAMHHCHRNLLGLGVNVNGEVDAFAGGRARFEFVLDNDTQVERYDIEIQIGEDGHATGDVPARHHHRMTVDLTVARRGVMRLAQFELRTRYPFGWFRAWTYVQTPLSVFAAPQARGHRALPATTAAPGSAARFESRGDEDFAGLRSYEAGVPLKHMAWKVVARGGEPAVRTYSGSAVRPEWLEWSALEQLDAESRLSQLCRWVLDGESEQRSYGLRLPQLEIAPAFGGAHRTACLRALALHPHPSTSP